MFDRPEVQKEEGSATLDFNQGHPATAIRASHKSLSSYTQLPSTALELTGTFRGAAAGPGTIISVTNAEQQHLSDHSLD